MKNLQDITFELSHKINSSTLPGISAQLKMAPELRKESLLSNSPDDAIRSSVLILLFPYENQVSTVLIQRPKYDGVHSGQVAFPGGKSEKEDKDLIETAKREAFEEIGVNGDIRILGSLTNIYIPPSNFLVTPVVAFAEKMPDFVLETKEVDSLIIVPLIDFFNGIITKNVEEFKVNKHDIVKAPCYKVGSYSIWGATAMILSEFLEIISPAALD